MDIKYILHRRLVQSNRKSAELSHALSEFINYPANVSFSGKNSKGKKVVTYTLTFTNQPDSVGWGILLGELAHSLRSSLDNAIFALSTTKTNKVEFPIFDNEVNYGAAIVEKLNGITNQTILDYVKAKQPFNESDPTSHPLYLLHKLNNADKHRLPKFVLLHPSELDTKLEIEFQNRVCQPVIQFNEMPIKSDVWFMKYKFKYPFNKFKDNTKFNIQAQIEIDNKRFGVKELCDNLVREVHEITNIIGNEL